MCLQLPPFSLRVTEGHLVCCFAWNFKDPLILAGPHHAPNLIRLQLRKEVPWLLLLAGSQRTRQYQGLHDSDDLSEQSGVAFWLRTPQSTLQVARNTEEKVRVLHRWIAQNISYNLEGLHSGSSGDTSAESVLQSRTGVCQGYVTLFKALCGEAGGLACWPSCKNKVHTCARLLMHAGLQHMHRLSICMWHV